MIDINFSKFFNNNIDLNFQTENDHLSFHDVAIPQQTHSANVKFVTEPGLYDDVDGLITSKKYKLKFLYRDIIKEISKANAPKTKADGNRKTPT